MDIPVLFLLISVIVLLRASLFFFSLAWNLAWGDTEAWEYNRRSLKQYRMGELTKEGDVLTWSALLTDGDHWIPRPVLSDRAITRVLRNP